MLHEHLRACDITRWNMVRTMRQQNVAEHSFNVALIAAELAQRIGLDHRKVAYLALTHDIDEVWTGDIPSITKQELKRNGMDWGKMEGAPSDDHATHGHIVKAADFIESIRFIRMYGQGAHAAEVAKWLEDGFESFLAKYPSNTFSEAARTVAAEADRTDFSIVSPHWGKEQ